MLVLNMLFLSLLTRTSKKGNLFSTFSLCVNLRIEDVSNEVLIFMSCSSESTLMNISLIYISMKKLSIFNFRTFDDEHSSEWFSGI